MDKTTEVIHTWLNHYVSASIKPGTPMGSVTNKHVIRAFQHCLNSEYGASVEVDGVFGPNTRYAGRRVYVSTTHENHGALAYILQAWMYLKGLKTNGFNGRYDETCKRSLQKYQKRIGLLDDGICRVDTFEQLARRNV